MHFLWNGDLNGVDLNGYFNWYKPYKDFVIDNQYPYLIDTTNMDSIKLINNNYVIYNYGVFIGAMEKFLDATKDIVSTSDCKYTKSILDIKNAYKKLMKDINDK